MKNSFKIVGIFSLVLILFATTTAFAHYSTSSGNDYSCTVTIKKGDSALSYVKVTTEVSGGISCIGGRDFETNKNGVVTLKWSKGCYLRKVYVKGRGYKVDYKDGNSYILYVK